MKMPIFLYLNRQFPDLGLSYQTKAIQIVQFLMRKSKQMKNKKIKSLLYFCLIASLSSLIVSCEKKTTTPTPTPCTVTGTTVNVGSTAGGQYYVAIATVQCPPFYSRTEYIAFSNITLNFAAHITNNGGVGSGCVNTGNLGIMDVGVQTCLDFAYSGLPNANLVAFKTGHGYVATFPSGNIVKFIANSYSNGNAKITYR